MCMSKNCGGSKAKKTSRPTPTNNTRTSYSPSKNGNPFGKPRVAMSYSGKKSQ